MENIEWVYDTKLVNSPKLVPEYLLFVKHDDGGIMQLESSKYESIVNLAKWMLDKQIDGKLIAVALH